MMPSFCKASGIEHKAALVLIAAIKSRADLANTSPGALAKDWVKKIGGTEQLWERFFLESDLAL